MKWLLCMALLATGPLVAADFSSSPLAAAATELDDLVSRERTILRKRGSVSTRDATAPLSLEKITPVVAERLKLTETEITETLKDERHKLSSLVMARALEKPVEKSWKDLLAQNQREDLIRLAHQQQIATNVQATLVDLHTELSFLVFDSVENRSSRGGPADSAKGRGKKGSSESQKAKRSE